MKRHAILLGLIGTKPEENLSYENAVTILIASTVCMISFCLLEVVSYFTYNRYFHPWKNILN